MTIVEAIRARHSVRTYTNTPLSEKDAAELSAYISSLTPPFGAKARIALIHVQDGGEAVKLGTYGVIKGASAYLALIHREGPLVEESAGYMFEQAVLKCTQMGLGTCWLGGTVNRSDFVRQANMTEGEHLLLVSPVGYPADKPRFIERMMRAGAKSGSRKPFDELFFDGGFDKPLTEEGAGAYLTPLEMVRLAPSASNSQPWRAVVSGEHVDFYYKKASGFSGFDLGIALCHFELSCRELGVKGSFEVDKTIVAYDKNIYVISWK